MLRSRRNKTHCFPWLQSLRALLNCERVISFAPGGTAILPRFQGARPDHMRVVSLGSYVSEFGPQHLTHSPPIGKRI